MVDAALLLPGDPALPARQTKDQKSPIADRKPDRAFASAVALGKDRVQVEPQDSMEAAESETIVLDPDMDQEAVVGAVAEAVTAFIAAAPVRQPDSGPLPRDASAMVIGLNTFSTAQLRNVLPELVGTQPMEAPPAAVELVPAVAMPVQGSGPEGSLPVVKTQPLPSQQSETIQPEQTLSAEKQAMVASAVPGGPPLVANEPDPRQPDGVPVTARTVDKTGTAPPVLVAMHSATAPFMQAVPLPPTSRPSPPSSERGAAKMDVSDKLAQNAGPLAAPDDGVEVAAIAPQPVAGTGDPKPESAGREPPSDADLPEVHNSQSAQHAQMPQQQNQPVSPIPPAGSQPTAHLMFLAGQPSLPALDQARMVQVLPPEPQAGQPQRQLEIILAPPELGAVRVVITRDDGEMRIEMVASTSRAVEVLERARESMVESIRDTGMRPGPIEIRQDLNAPRNLGSGEFANNSSWHGRHEQARQQSGDTRSFPPDRAPAPIGLATGNGARGRQGLIL